MSIGRYNIASLAFAVVLLGLTLRLYRLDHQSVWFDEAFSMVVSAMPLGPMTEQIVRDFVHPPLHYYLLHAWFGMFGFGVLQARLLSVLFGVLSIVAIYVLAKYLFDRQTGLLAAALLAFSELGVMYSQEARPYAQFLFFVLASVYLFLVALRDKRASAWWGFVASAIAMIYTHYYGVLVLLCLVLFAIVRKNQYMIPRHLWIAGAAITLIVYIPWMASGVVGNALHSTKTAAAAQIPFFAVHWWSPISAINWFNNGKFLGFQVPSPWWGFLPGFLLFTLPALLAMKSPPGEFLHREGVLLLVGLCILPILVVTGLGLLSIQYTVRYITFCAAPYYVLVARGIETLNSQRLCRLLVAFILIYSTFSLRANYFIPYKENYRDALGYLVSEYRDGDCCLFLPPSRQRPVPIYWLVYYRDLPSPRVTTFDEIASRPTNCGRVWLVLDTFKTWVPEWNRAVYEERVRQLETTHSKASERLYNGMNVRLYLPGRP